jgi:hypothetical protein
MVLRINYDYVALSDFSSTGDSVRFLRNIKKGKGKVFPVHTMKAYRGSRGIAPLMPNLGTR